MTDRQTLQDIDIEVKALKTALSGGEVADAMFDQLKEEHFHFKSTKQLFLRVTELKAGQEQLPTWRMAITDAKLGEGVKAALQDQFEESVEAKTLGDVEFVAAAIDDLAKKRSLYDQIFEAQTDLFSGEKSVNEIASQFTASLATLEKSQAEGMPEIIFGAGYSVETEKVFNNIVYNKEALNVIKTGFHSFDDRSGGHQRGNLVVWGATSGGGKSVMAVNLLVRQYLMGHSVVLASYEMNHEEITNRILAIISEVPLADITMKRLTPEQVVKAECAWRNFNLAGMKKNNSFYLMCPTNETTISDVAKIYKSKKPATVIFDYINLLTSRSKHAEAQWQMLGEIAKEGKVCASANDCVVHLLIQVDKEHNIRYSQAIKDHANWVSAWVYDDEARANGFVTVKQIKARSAACYDYQLITRFDISQFRDPDEEDKAEHFTYQQFEEIQEQAREAGVLLDINAPVSPSKVIRAEKTLAPQLEEASVRRDVERKTPARTYNIDFEDAI